MRLQSSLFAAFWGTLLAPFPLQFSGGCVSRFDPTRGALLVPARPLLALAHGFGLDSMVARSFCVGLSYGLACLLVGTVLARLWRSAAQ